MPLDLVVRDGKVVVPPLGLFEADIGIDQGKVVALRKNISEKADRTIDAHRKIVFPGVVDAHSHFGIYRPLEEDAVSESRAAVTGGITTVVNIVRPRPYYLNMTGPLTLVLQRLLELSQNSYITDYCYTLAPVERSHLGELGNLVDSGVPTFKFFMHYRDYKFSDEPYDTGFLYDLMRVVAGLRPRCSAVRLSIHCEDPEIIRVSGQTGYGIGQAENTHAFHKENPLETYNSLRPPLAEALGISKAMFLANVTSCPIYIVHVTSNLAINTAIQLKRLYGVDATLEATIHHLMLTTDSKAGVYGKVNPPIRKKEDVAALWQALDEGEIDVVASDHAAVPKKMKEGDVFSAIFGFGGNTLLLPGLLSEGYIKRKMPLVKLAQLVTYNPARILGLYPLKGTIMVGSDADLTIVDLNKTQKVSAELLNSAQEFTPFEGIEVTGWPTHTIVRGNVVYEDGVPTGRPGTGRFVRRPVTREPNGP